MILNYEEVRKQINGAAEEVCMMQHHKTTFRWIAITGTNTKDGLKLNVSTEEYQPEDEWIRSSYQVVCFDKSLIYADPTANILNPHLVNEFSEIAIENTWYNNHRHLHCKQCQSIAESIWIALNDIPREWFGFPWVNTTPDLDHQLYSYLVNKDYMPAAMLAHILLPDLAKNPIQNAARIFTICDEIKSVLRLSIRDELKSLYAQAILLGLNKLSQATNEQVLNLHNTGQPVGSELLECHRNLSMHAKEKTYHEKFHHQPDEVSTAYLM